MDKAERLAKKFHETYEILAPKYNYKTREASSVSWENVPDNNKELMVAVCKEILTTQDGKNVTKSDKVTNKQAILERILREHGFEHKRLVTGEVYCVAFEGSELADACKDILDFLTAQDGEAESPNVRVLFGSLLDKWFDLPLSVREWEEFEEVNKLFNAIEAEIHKEGEG